MKLRSDQLLLLPAEELGREPLEERLLDIDWSYSRRITIERCPRQYFYEYFGVKSGSETDQLVLDVRRLKALSNRYLRAGELAHWAISRFFRQSQRGIIIPPERLAVSAVSRFRGDVEYSKTVVGGRPSTGFDQAIPPVLLREFLYDPPSATGLCAEAEERLRQALITFATASAFGEMRREGARQGAVVEQPFWLKRLGCRVQGKIDLAYRAYGCVAVVDWKLGDTEAGGSDSLQLALYGLWATGHFECSLSDVSIRKAYLGSGEVVELRLDERVLKAAELRIIQDAMRMETVRPYGEAGKWEAFSPHASPGICALCPYPEICPEGREVASA